MNPAAGAIENLEVNHHSHVSKASFHFALSDNLFKYGLCKNRISVYNNKTIRIKFIRIKNLLNKNKERKLACEEATELLTSGACIHSNDKIRVANSFEAWTGETWLLQPSGLRKPTKSMTILDETPEGSD